MIGGNQLFLAALSVARLFLKNFPNHPVLIHFLSDKILVSKGQLITRCISFHMWLFHFKETKNM